MTPKFADPIAYQQAELLMQPAFIRVIDNIRKQLEQSTWKGTYRDTLIWTEDVPAELQERVVQLRRQLTDADPDAAAAIEQTLAHLPQPIPGYELHLEHQGKQVKVDLWELCYQVCFDGYVGETGEQEIAIDTSLIDDAGEVDWQRLDDKTKQIIQQIFAALPAGG